MKNVERFVPAAVVLSTSLFLNGCAAGETEPNQTTPETIVSPDITSSETDIAGESTIETDSEPKTTIYLETWLTDDDYDRIAEVLKDKNVNIIIAFGEPTADGRINVSDLDYSAAGISKVLSQLGPEATVSLALGGWGGDDADHESILNGFETAANNPEMFAQQVKTTLSTVSQQIGHDITGIDIDWEYPEFDDAEGLTAIIITLNDTLPDVKISIAVPADYGTEGFVAALESILPYVVRIHVMTYDENTPYYDDGTGDAGPIATTAGVKKAYLEWVARVRGISPADIGKAVLGFSTACYEYGKASGYDTVTGRWDRFTSVNPAEIPFAYIAGNAVVQPADGSTWLEVPGGVASCTTPDDVIEIIDAFEQAPPQIFYWSSAGLVDGYPIVGGK